MGSGFAALLMRSPPTSLHGIAESRVSHQPGLTFFFASFFVLHFAFCRTLDKRGGDELDDAGAAASGKPSVNTTSLSVCWEAPDLTAVSLCSAAKTCTQRVMPYGAGACKRQHLHVCPHKTKRHKSANRLDLLDLPLLLNSRWLT